MARITLAILMALSMTLAGCIGNGEGIVEDSEMAPIWETYNLIDTREPTTPGTFTTVDLRTNQSTTTSWAIFDASNGGNCCEHYLATSIHGTIMNIGGEYPVWSNDRGQEWDTFVPPAIPDQTCRTFIPTNPGQEGLGEGSIVQATNGDWISMSWFPYVGGDLKLDKFYAILYDESEMEWKWCYNRLTEPFYDRSWQVEVVGPIDASIGSGDWASLVVSNFWHQTQNAGGQISVDGLNYYPIQFPNRGGSEPSLEVNLSFSPEDMSLYWDVNKPHKEMRAFSVPSGGLMFPQYFDNGNAAFLGHHTFVERG